MAQRIGGTCLRASGDFVYITSQPQNTRTATTISTTAPAVIAKAIARPTTLASSGRSSPLMSYVLRTSTSKTSTAARRGGQPRTGPLTRTPQSRGVTADPFSVALTVPTSSFPSLPAVLRCAHRPHSRRVAGYLERDTGAPLGRVETSCVVATCQASGHSPYVA